MVINKLNCCVMKGNQRRNRQGSSCSRWTEKEFDLQSGAGKGRRCLKNQSRRRNNCRFEREQLND